MNLIVVAGNPINHSLSPEMHNAAFRHLGLDDKFNYEKMEVEYLDEFIPLLKSREIFGANITVPHKIEVCQFLDRLTPLAEKIGAVNTIFFEDGKLIGDNTDGQGAREALLEKTGIKGKKIAIIGAGGAARAIAYSLPEARLDIFNRSEEKGKALADSIGAGSGPLDDPRIKEADIIINCTFKGMARDPDPPIDTNFLNNQVVMDIIYTPRTVLLQEAEKKGCITIDGTSMLVYQGALSFRRWTGKDAPIDVMKKALIDALELIE